MNALNLAREGLRSLARESQKIELYPRCPKLKEAQDGFARDREAIGKYWTAVGGDIKRAIEKNVSKA